MEGIHSQYKTFQLQYYQNRLLATWEVHIIHKKWRNFSQILGYLSQLIWTDIHLAFFGLLHQQSEILKI